MGQHRLLTLGSPSACNPIQGQYIYRTIADKIKAEAMTAALEHRFHAEPL